MKIKISLRFPFNIYVGQRVLQMLDENGRVRFRSFVGKDTYDYLEYQRPFRLIFEYRRFWWLWKPRRAMFKDKENNTYITFAWLNIGLFAMLSSTLFRRLKG